MANRITKKRTRTVTNTKIFHSHRGFYLLSGFLSYLSLSSRIYTHSSSLGSSAGTVQPPENARNRLRAPLLRQHNLASLGFYYGISRRLIEPFLSNERSGDGGSNDDFAPAKRRYLARYESMGRDVEKWPERIMHEQRSNDVNSMGGAEITDDWTEVFCAKAIRNRFNSGSNNTVPLTRQWVKWMRDSREQYADPNDRQKHPCMKLIATIDAPFPIVCRYLSEKDRFPEYNSLLVDQEDVEVLTPHSKICWSQSKKLLFIQPRDFMTYCRHRWLKDGTQLITNQACDHPLTNQPLSDSCTNTTNPLTDRVQSQYRAFSLRGATYISRCPRSPIKRTKVVMLSHCNCGRDIPEWAVRAAVGVLAPIKPFEIIHRINVGIRRTREELEAKMKTETGSTTKTAFDSGRSSQPAGMAQMGYACFWPEGGGLVDDFNE